MNLSDVAVMPCPYDNGSWNSDFQKEMKKKNLLLFQVFRFIFFCVCLSVLCWRCRRRQQQQFHSNVCGCTGTHRSGCCFCMFLFVQIVRMQHDWICVHVCARAHDSVCMCVWVWILFFFLFTVCERALARPRSHYYSSAAKRVYVWISHWPTFRGRQAAFGVFSLRSNRSHVCAVCVWCGVYWNEMSENRSEKSVYAVHGAHPSMTLKNEAWSEWVSEWMRACVGSRLLWSFGTEPNETTHQMNYFICAQEKIRFDIFAVRIFFFLPELLVVKRCSRMGF